jgi:hypothetical protein
MESARLVFDFPRASFAIASTSDQSVLDDAAERFEDSTEADDEGGLDE